MSSEVRATYEENAAFIKATVERLERGEVSIDELESIAAQMSQSFQFCQDRLAKTRQVVAETMKQAAPASDC
ncbi:exodeoxyribonuclease VII small subunit [Pseudomonas sp.]|uniref:exodeoxyribonuclease VII small subunit n=1 Tax=Pseudomonas sp. TaxID=306 RepID=UPI00289E9694|nr:exodeoxyribonuclease VII small subunit [Pseudomonas sp.]